jgi:hypothetical protein
MVELKNHRNFLAALTVFTVAQLAIVLLRWDKPLIWDSSVYVGMGKNLFSLGKIGFWESFRPPALPILIGSIWKTGLFFPNLARLFGTAISILGAATIYRIIDIEFDRGLALYTALILMSTMVYIRWSHYFLTGIPAAVLAFVSLHYAKHSKPMKSGIVVAAAFLTRFPAAIAGTAAGITLFLNIIPLKDLTSLKFDLKDIREVLESEVKLGLSFGVPTAFYFALNHFYGSGFFSPVIGGASVPTLNPDKYLYGLYFLKEAVVANPLLIFVPLGLYSVFRARDTRFYPYVSGLALFYAFFTFYPHKEPRFMLLFLPMMALFAAHGIRELNLPETVSGYFTKDKLFVAAVALVFLVNFSLVFNMNTWDNAPRSNYMSETANLEGTVAGLNPAPVVYGDFKFIAVRPETYENTSEKAFREADYFALETCSWYCSPAIDSCEQKKAELFDRLENETKVFEDSASQCSYRIYELNN